MADDLKNFSIDSLFPNKNNKTNKYTGSFDVNSIFATPKQDYDFNPESLLDINNERKKILQNQYYSIFKKCCDTIKSANNCGYVQIVYEIPQYSDCIGYKCIDCIIFLKEKLEEKKLNVYKINTRTIKISWDDLEEKINKQKNNTNTNDKFVNLNELWKR
jgi:hypothetical protein